MKYKKNNVINVSRYKTALLFFSSDVIDIVFQIDLFDILISFSSYCVNLLILIHTTNNLHVIVKINTLVLVNQNMGF